MIFVHVKIQGFTIYFSARRVEENRSSLRFLASLQKVQRSQLIGHPAGERIFLPPNNTRDRSKVKDRILSFNGLLDCAVIPDVTPNLLATQRPDVGAEIQVIECDSITHDFELFR